MQAALGRGPVRGDYGPVLRSNSCSGRPLRAAGRFRSGWMADGGLATHPQLHWLHCRLRRGVQGWDAGPCSLLGCI